MTAEEFFVLAYKKKQEGDANTQYRMLQSALEIDGNHAGAWYMMGEMMHEAKKYAAAAACFSRSAMAMPDVHETQVNIGWNLHQAGRSAEAIASTERGIQLDPSRPMPWTNLNAIWLALGNPHRALSASLTAVRLREETKESNPVHQLALSFAEFWTGDLVEAFKNYEARIPYRVTDFLSYPMPMWRGEKVDRLIVQAEQGLGDAIMAFRWMPKVYARAGHVIFLVHSELQTLFWDNLTVDEQHRTTIIPMPAPIPDADAFCPMMSLPVAFKTTLADLKKNQGATLRIDQPILRGVSPKLKVALCWAGDPRQDNESNRRIPLAAMMMLADIPGVELYSVQMGETANDLLTHGAHVLIRDMSPHIRDMRDTARIIDRMDLVISSCTSVAHLAGALGTETWLLTPQQGCHWAWSTALGAGDGTYWYPRMRLFRRGLDEIWWTILRDKVRPALQQAAEAHRGRTQSKTA